MSSEEIQPIHDESAEIAASLQEVEIALAALQDRYRQITEAQARKTELENEFSQKELIFRENPLTSLEIELGQIRDQIQEIEVILESNLLKEGELKRLFWDGVRRGLLGEIFWQIVRFGGIGVLLGWMLKSCAG